MLWFQRPTRRWRDECKVDDRRVDGGHAKGGVFAVELNGQEGGLAVHAVVQLVKAGLNALELGRRLVDLGFHEFRVVHELAEVLLRRLRIIQLNLKEKLRAEEIISCVLVNVRE